MRPQNTPDTWRWLTYCWTRNEQIRHNSVFLSWDQIWAWKQTNQRRDLMNIPDQWHPDTTQTLATVAAKKQWLVNISTDSWTSTFKTNLFQLNHYHFLNSVHMFNNRFFLAYFVWCIIELYNVRFWIILIMSSSKFTFKCTTVFIVFITWTSGTCIRMMPVWPANPDFI